MGCVGKFCFLLTLSYIIGSIPTGYWVGKAFFHKDIRSFGSGNLGASNAYRVLGPVAGVSTLLFDIMKGAAAVLLLPKLFLADMSILQSVLLGVGAIAGHTWTVFLKFHGGKGVAVSAGVFLALSWKGMLAGIIVFAVIFFLFRYVSLASLAATITMPVFLILFHEPKELVLFSVIIGMIIIVRHRENIRRLIRGEENRLH